MSTDQAGLLWVALFVSDRWWLSWERWRLGEYGASRHAAQIAQYHRARAVVVYDRAINMQLR